MSGGKGKKRQAAAMPGAPKKRARKVNKRTLSPPLGASLLSVPQSDSETGPESETQDNMGNHDGYMHLYPK